MILYNSMKLNQNTSKGSNITKYYSWVQSIQNKDNTEYKLQEIICKIELYHSVYILY
jgi:hypothetical protein